MAEETARATTEKPLNEVYLTFVGSIDNAAAHRITQGMSTAMINGVDHVHLLFQSFGGAVGDGVFLYNYFLALPIGLTLYNLGKIESIATIAFLGAKKRKVSTHATFMIHRTVITQERATARRLESTTKSLLLDDERTEAILKNHLKMPEDRWKELEYHDVNFSATEAVEVGLADEVAEFAPPPRTQIFDL